MSCLLCWSPDASATRDSAVVCDLSDQNLGFIQQALASWERGGRLYLRLDPEPLPWMILFDGSCVWHLAPDEEATSSAAPVELALTFAGAAVKARAEAHDGNIHLPDGVEIPARATAFASLYEQGRKPFLVLALLDIWRRDPWLAETPGFETIVLGTMSHEIVHTRQLAAVAQRVRALAGFYPLSGDIHDDIIEERFHDAAGYKAAFDAEKDLLYQAVAQQDAKQRRSLVAEAVMLAGARRDRYFTGSDAVYRDLEDLFLNMEGVAVWLAFKLAREKAGHDHDAHRFKWARSTWSHDQGLALFLLIDLLVPGWQERVLGPELASPFALLEEALARQDGGSAAKTR